MDISRVGCRSLCFWQVPQKLHFLHNRVENTGQGHIFIFRAFLSVKIGGLFESYWVFLFPSLLSHTPSEMNVKSLYGPFVYKEYAQ